VPISEATNMTKMIIAAANGEKRAATRLDPVGPVIISEIGVDMKCFASPAELASWSRLCPPNNQSAGKRRRGKWSGHNRWLPPH
jgi:transposase